MPGMLYLVTLSKESRYRPKADKIRIEIDKIISLTLGRESQRKTWKAKVFDSPPPVQDLGIFTVIRKISFQKIGGHLRTQDKDWAKIYAKLSKVAGSSTRKWKISSDHAPKITMPVVHIPDDVKDYAPLNLEMDGHFDHIFGLDAQIRRIMSVLRLAKQTDMRKRLHCVLHGKPGCGKSEIISALGKMLGIEKQHYIQFDATSTTQAGAINTFLTSPYVPPVLLVEEIEKTHPNDQRWMLGLLDQRAEIRQTNFRVGNRARNVRVLCIATCNDLQLFKNVMSGALASRFTHKIQCPRPNRQILEKILKREIEQVPGGSMDWIFPTLDFATSLNIDDPREIVAICLSGQYDLLNGQFQKDFRCTTEN